MTELPSIESVVIKLEVNQQQLLYIRMSISGAVSRAGDGSPEEAAFVFMGRTDQPFLESWLDQLSPDMMEMTGRYTFPNPQGDHCVLSITLEGPDTDTGFEFTYGSLSDGPPEDIIELVEAAMDITDEWYAEQKNSRRQNRKKG
ncbi:MAG: hypothetical protein R3C61_08900 [Bacteroidia bacterium]